VDIPEDKIAAALTVILGMILELPRLFFFVGVCSGHTCSPVLCLTVVLTSSVFPLFIIETKLICDVLCLHKNCPPLLPIVIPARPIQKKKCKKRPPEPSVAHPLQQGKA
jgi:hypothetical protein